MPSVIRRSVAARPSTGPRPEPLWREVTGSVLRAERRRQHRSLAQVAERAGMSVQYLSELERGRKEASSEMLGAACGSLGLSLAEFATRCARTITSAAARPSGPVLLAA
jgi:transcriptional regulator with XRE-family HTH domain